MLIRPAKTDDVPSIKRLLYETWVDTYGHFVPTAVLDQVTSQWHAAEKLVAEISKKGIWLVAEETNGHLAGVLSANLGSGGVVALARLYVLPRHQRRGLGRKLYDAMVARCPGAKSIHLEVEELNPRGRAFYRKLGFKEGDRVRQDLGPIEAYVFKMAKSLE